jgi:hypothetical protein
MAAINSDQFTDVLINNNFIVDSTEFNGLFVTNVILNEAKIFPSNVGGSIDVRVYVKNIIELSITSINDFKTIYNNDDNNPIFEIVYNGITLISGKLLSSLIDSSRQYHLIEYTFEYTSLTINNLEIPI